MASINLQSFIDQRAKQWRVPLELTFGTAFKNFLTLWERQKLQRVSPWNLLNFVYTKYALVLEVVFQFYLVTL